MHRQRNKMHSVRKEISEARRLIAKCIEETFPPELTPHKEFDRLLKKLDKGD